MATPKTPPKSAPKSTSKTASRASPKPAAKAPSPKAQPKAPAPPPTVKAEKPAKPPKVTLVRDSFTMPEPDFALITVLKARALGAKRTAKKSELLRAGLQALAALDSKALVAALDRLAPVKTGRPKKGN